MWHVDEGTVHAFLDEQERPGSALDAATRLRVAQHVRECAECAAAVEREAHVRGLAALVLADAAPSAIELPRFDELPQATSPRRRRRWATLAWAASIAAAVGAGWMGSELWRSGLPARRAELEEASVPETGDSRADAPASVQVAEPQLAERAAAVPGEAGRSPARVAGAGESGRMAPVEQDAARPAAPPSLVAGAEPQAGVVVPPANVGAVAEARDASRRAEPQAQKAVESVAPTAVSAAPRRMFQGQAALADAAPAGYPGDEDVAWVPATQEAAERRLGEPLLLVPGAPVDSVWLSAAGRVRVRQRTEPGLVELIQWPAPALRDAQLEASWRTGVARDSAEFAGTRAGGLEVVLKAPRGTSAAQLLLRAMAARRIR